MFANEIAGIKIGQSTCSEVLSVVSGEFLYSEVARYLKEKN